MLTLLFPLALVAAFGAPAPADDPPPVALKGLDPVLLVSGQEAPGAPEYASDHGRFRYLFATPESKARFDADPARFAAQGDGMCAVMPRSPGSPEIFLVHAGRIFVFGSERCRDRFREQPDAYAPRRRNVAILVYDGVELLDFAGPGEVFTWADHGRAFHVYTVAERPGPVLSQGFLKITPAYTLDDCPPPDLLVIPGGSTWDEGVSEPLKRWLVRASADAEVTVSVCTGAFLLGRAGLLDGLEATTHQAFLEALRLAAPRATVVSDRRYVDRGRIVTAGGVAAGLDVSLHVVERLLGPEVATETAQILEYRRRPATDPAAATTTPNDSPSRADEPQGAPR